ncbi:NrfC protein [Vibrio variabilis]|nr:NrfC protein [Vibrio variabilis]
MSCSRRNFLAGTGAVIFTTGVATTSVLTARNSVASDDTEKAVRYGMLHDENACIGCTACTDACREVNKVPEGVSSWKYIAQSLLVSILMSNTDSLASPASTVKTHRAFMCVQQALHTKMRRQALSTCTKKSVSVVVTVWQLALSSALFPS